MVTRREQSEVKGMVLVKARRRRIMGVEGDGNWGLGLGMG